jgi:Cu(I)/Ag(I) efflux system membrane fusion protein
MKNTLSIHAAVAVIALLALLPGAGAASGQDESEILYWVAPMDPGFRRDQPGKSPMGMDLVPVYADQAAGEAGTVSIDPVVVQNLGVRSADVERGNLWRLIETLGYAALDERKLSHVHLRTPGWIEKLYFKSDGDRVKKGQVLFELYSRELVNAQEEYLQTLGGSNDFLKRAARERLAALGMSKEQIQEVASSRRASQRVRVLARQDGIVHGLNAREGMYVEPAMEIMTLADLSSIWLLVDVFERQADWVAVGQPAEVRLAYLPGRVWEGEVEFVYPTIDPKTRTLRARLRFDNPDETLKPNMYADVRIYAGPKRDVLSVPREALIRTGHAERVVVALGEGKFSAREVVSGMESGDWVEIVSGLAEGERVVVSGQFLIDSEASLRASFSRMGSDNPPDASVLSTAPPRGTGTLLAIDPEQRTLHIDHDPLEALGWPAMAMDFKVADQVPLDGITTGDRVQFTLGKDSAGGYRIDSLQAQE